MSSKFTFITPFFQRHGVGFLDVILKAIDEHSAEISEKGISKNQYEAIEEIEKNGTLNNLEKIIYLLPADYQIHKGARSLWKEFKSPEKLALVKSSIQEISQNAEESIEDLDKLIKYLDDNENKEFPNYQWLEKNWRNRQDVWHIINEFSLSTQVEWYKKNSTILEKNGSKKIEFIELDLTYAQLEDEEKVAGALKKWLMKTNLSTKTYINLWGVATSFQLAFYYLSWSTPKLKQSTFIKCTTPKKAIDTKRFTPLKIIHTNKDLLATLESNNNKLSTKQLDTFAWLKKYKEFGDNFTIMLLGPRGTGKTKVVTEVYDEKNQIISVNCAQFQSTPELARSELFGHKKGAFTGAIQDKVGAFQQTDNQVLFLDEVHHLDKATQAMLLMALQTDSDGYFQFTPLGASEVTKSKFQLIVASNKKQDELEKFILPDLLDRITQRVLKFNALETGPSIEKIFNTVWNDMGFMGNPSPVNPLLEESNDNFDLEFQKWLTDKSRKFEGNYRDLQKISILVADYQRCKIEPKLIKRGLTLVNYLKQNWKPASKKKEICIENFLNEQNKVDIKNITNEFKAKIARSAEYLSGDQQLAADMLGISKKSLIDLKNRDK